MLWGKLHLPYHLEKIYILFVLKSFQFHLVRLAIVDLQ